MHLQVGKQIQVCYSTKEIAYKDKQKRSLSKRNIHLGDNILGHCYLLIS